MGVNSNTIKQFNQNQQANANQQPAPSPVTNVNSKMSVSDIQLMQKDVNTLTDEEKLRKKALETKSNLQQIDDKKKKEQEAQDEEDIRQGNITNTVLSEANRSFKAASDKTSPIVSWFENAPAPGGIGLLLLIIGVFLMAIVPIDNNGNTRLMLLWLTLTGKTHINYSQDNTASTQTNSVPSTPTTAQPVANTPAPAPTGTMLSFPNVDLGITSIFGL